MENRILATAQKYQDLLAGLPAEKIAKAEQTVQLDTMAGPTYQSWQSRAHAAGILSLDEATTIYRALSGESAEWSEEAPLSLRLAITQTMVELGKAFGIGA